MTITQKLIYPLVGVVIGLVGFANAGYVTYNRMTGQLPPCTPPFQCEKVLNSPWFNPAGISLPSLGLVFFGAVFILNVVFFLQTDSNKGVTVKPYIWVMSLVGAAFGLYTISAMTFLIKGYCVYCVISDILLGLNLAVNIWFRRSVAAQ